MENNILIKNQDIKKHIAIIHCLNTLSLLQRKISNALLWHAYHRLAEKEEHEITINQLCKIIGYRGNNHAVIKQSLRGLVSTVMEWNIIDEKSDEEDWTASTLLASVRIKGPNCLYAYSPRMKELLYHPSMYGEINLIIQSKFKSSYGLALYENCVRYKRMPCTKWFDYPVFKKLMGVPVGQYEIFRDFKRRVLDKSVEEVNTHSNILVVPEINKQAGKVIAIRFLIRQKIPEKKMLGKIRMAQDAQSDLNQQHSKLLEQLVNTFKLTENLAKQLVQDYSEILVQEKIDLIFASNSFKKGAIKDLASYLISALKNNYNRPEPSSIKAENLNKKKFDSKIDDLKDEYYKFQSHELCRHIEQIDITTKNKILENFVPHLQKNGGIYYDVYKSQGLASPLVGDFFLRYIKLKEPKLLEEIISFEEFIKEK